MRLVPAHPAGGKRAQVQAVDGRAGHGLGGEAGVVGDQSGHQGGAELAHQLLLGHLDHGDEGEQELGLGQGVVGAVAPDDGGQDEPAAAGLGDAVAVAVLRRQVLGAAAGELGVQIGRHGLGGLAAGEGGQGGLGVV